MLLQRAAARLPDTAALLAVVACVRVRADLGHDGGVAWVGLWGLLLLLVQVLRLIKWVHIHMRSDLKKAGRLQLLERLRHWHVQHMVKGTFALVAFLYESAIMTALSALLCEPGATGWTLAADGRVVCRG